MYRPQGSGGHGRGSSGGPPSRDTQYVGGGGSSSSSNGGKPRNDMALLLEEMKVCLCVADGAND